MRQTIFDRIRSERKRKAADYESDGDKRARRCEDNAGDADDAGASDRRNAPTIGHRFERFDFPVRVLDAGDQRERRAVDGLRIVGDARQPADGDLLARQGAPRIGDRGGSSPQLGLVEGGQVDDARVGRFGQLGRRHVAQP